MGQETGYGAMPTTDMDLEQKAFDRIDGSRYSDTSRRIIASLEAHPERLSKVLVATEAWLKGFLAALGGQIPLAVSQAAVSMVDVLDYYSHKGLKE